MKKIKAPKKDKKLKEIGEIKIYKTLPQDQSTLTYKLQELKTCRDFLKFTVTQLILDPIVILSAVLDLVNNPNKDVSINIFLLSFFSMSNILAILTLRKKKEELKQLKAEIVNFLQKYEPEQIKTDEDAQQLAKRI